MASGMTLKRLNREYKNILKFPINNISTRPLPDDILIWHYVITPPQKPYIGCYHGYLKFPEKYPFKPPSIFMITPSGRFETNTRLCLTMSDFHIESWNPSWNIETLLIGIMSFFYEESPASIGSIQDTESNRKRYARDSLVFNSKNEIFKELFHDFLIPHSCTTTTNLPNNSNSPMCRICFDNTGALVSPCFCTDKVHISCLKTWQKSVILNQSTHPKYQSNIDTVCNVCMEEYTIKSESREELMLRYTGPELTNMLKLGCYIIASRESSEYNEKLIEEHKDNEYVVNNLTHWIKGVYLIVNIIDNEGICAIDMTREVERFPDTVSTLDNKEINMKYVMSKYYSYIDDIDYIDKYYYMGGPCNPESLMGIAILKDLNKLQIKLETVRLIPTVGSLNEVVVGPIKSILKLVKIYSESNNITEKIRVNIFSGFGGWGRVQLLSEISKGSWGVLHSTINDIEVMDSNIWDLSNKRSLFVVKNEFSQN